MRQQHEIVEQVYAAKRGGAAADGLVRQYLPFIKAETARLTGRVPQEGRDDELSIAMFAFYESALSYEKDRGAFLPYAARAIRNRLIDYGRKEARHSGLASIDGAEGDDERTLLEKLDTGCDEVALRIERRAAREEILMFSQELADFGLTMGDIADNCPKQERTLAACRDALEYAKANPELFDALLETKKLPIARLSQGAGVERKTLERHRKYLVAILLAYTNGFEIIRGHLKQTAAGKGGRAV